MIDFEPHTADGVIVKRGDIVWRVVPGFPITRKVVDANMLRVWRAFSYERETHSTERAAVAAALEAAKKRLAKAKAAVRNETRAIAKLRGRVK